jgi:hypothetical protein
MSMRAVVSALATALAACTQPTTSAPPAPAIATNPDEQTAALATALAATVSAEIGRTVALDVRASRVMNEWAWVIAMPTQPDGAAIDWSRTALASRDENGVLGDNGMTYALLRQDNGAWTVIEHVIGPTDVAWLDWPARHGAPEALFEMPQDPPAP